MTDPIRIALLGADGRMGIELVRQVLEHPETQLVAGVTAPKSENIGRDLGELAGLNDFGVQVSTDLRGALERCDVLIDFSSPKAAIDAALMMHSVRCRAMVSGTTGFSQSEDRALDVAAESVCLVQSWNFSPGVNVLTALVERASKVLPEWDAEILEMHHNQKADAPSGTALMLGKSVAAGRDIDFYENAVLARKGMTGARQPGEIGFAALRGGGVIGDHEVRLAAGREMITLSHMAFDRSVFAAGALDAAIWASRQDKGIYDMHDVLGLKF